MKGEKSRYFSGNGFFTVLLSVTENGRLNYCLENEALNYHQQSTSFLLTSTKETNTAAIIPNAWPASKVGAPHCSGYGILILQLAFHEYPKEIGDNGRKRGKRDGGYREHEPRRRRDEVGSVSTAVELSSQRSVFVGTTNSQYVSIGPNESDGYEHCKSLH